MTNFQNKWSKQPTPTITEKVHETIKPKGPLKPRIEGAIKKIQIQIAKLDKLLTKLKQNDERIFQKIVTATQEHDTHSTKARLAMFLMVGSHNQNTRSLALDGEVAFVTASWKSLSGLIDFITIAGLCDWIDSLEELEELFPGYDGMARRISRFIRMQV